MFTGDRAVSGNAGTGSLEQYGFTPAVGRALAELGDPELRVMRVVVAERGAWGLEGDGERITATAPGRIWHTTEATELPVVGDWVAVRQAGDSHLIEAVLARRNRLSRRDPDQRSEQVLVANIDQAVIVMGLDGDFNLRRLERYLVLTSAAGIDAIVVLSKADLHPPGERLGEVHAIAGDRPVVAANLIAPRGSEPIAECLQPRSTSVLLGSSGVGKSTLINSLAGKAMQRTQPVRKNDSRGRHTTTRRQLFRLPSGVLIIDTPGLRELDPMTDVRDAQAAFEDIEQLAANCRFRNCRHDREPGCAVRAAVEVGTLAAERLASYRKISS